MNYDFKPDVYSSDFEENQSMEYNGHGYEISGSE